MRFRLVGNRLCIDFANTLVAADGSGDALRSWDDLIGFLEAAAAVTRAEADRLRTLGAADRRASTRAVAQALALRAALRELLAAMAAGRRIAPAWVGPVNAALEAAEGHEALAPAGRGWRRRFVARRAGPLAALAVVARSAAELIEEGRAAPVRKCGSPRCILYFYDVSRARRRRWCSMAVCGNRMKVAAHARRARAGRRR